MFNNYFIENPQINEDNLVAFNNKMKGKKVPKQTTQNTPATEVKTSIWGKIKGWFKKK